MCYALDMHCDARRIYIIMQNYKDIINKQRYIPIGRTGMSVVDRAAQFAPFAALTGFDGVILETGRLTDRETDMDEGELLAMNQTLCALMEELDTQPAVTLTWFRPDDRKEGGAYLSFAGNLKKVDTYDRLLIFTDGTRIPIDSLRYIQKNED